MFKNRKINYKLLIRLEIAFSILVVSFICAIFVSRHVPEIKNAWVLATTVEPETFTELYFEDHTNLPKTITKFKHYTFAFTLHNIEYKTVTYPYSVYLQRGDQKIILDQGTVTLKDNEYKTIQEEFGPLKNLRAKIVVELTDKYQIIDFWMDQI